MRTVGREQSAISLRDLVYEIAGKRVLSNVNLEIAKGEIVSVMGQSGSGKTTLLKLMAGLLKPTSGQILIDGTDIAAMSEAELVGVRLKMGLVFQYAALFDSLTVYENVVFGVVRHRKRVSRAELNALATERLAQVELSGIERQYPSELSGGMQKRVGLARALAMDPDIVFYDEPTSGLDPITATKIDNLILSTRDRMGITSVVVSHHLPSIFRISDRIAMLINGEIGIFGTAGDLRSSPNPAVQTFIRADEMSGDPGA